MEIQNTINPKGSAVSFSLFSSLSQVCRRRSAEVARVLAERVPGVDAPHYPSIDLQICLPIGPHRVYQTRVASQGLSAER